MSRLVRFVAALAFLVTAVGARADDFSDTTALFRQASESTAFFKNSYGYAVYPTVGEGGFIVAGAHGTGRVYVKGKYVGDTSVTQVSVGAQAGAQAYSQIVFFKDARAYKEFTSGSFEFSADATAVAITAGAGMRAGTGGANANVSGGQNNAGTKGGYHKGMAVFTVVKGGAMVQAVLAGQKYSYTPKS